MVESKISIEWIFDDPQKVAYNIWEAIRYANKSKKEEFKQYTTLLDKYKIRAIEPNIVKAELRTAQVLSPDGIIVRDVNDVLSMIGVAIELKASKLIFAESFDLDEMDKKILSDWCSNNTYTLIINEDGKIELRKKDD
jgi:hypothetical protein